MAKYQKKPIIVEAWEVRELLYLAERYFWNLPARIIEAYDKAELIFGATGIHIHTLEGVMLANRDDYIIQGTRNELYPCKPDVFSQVYEPVEV